MGDIGDPEKWRDFNDAYEKLVEKITHINNPQIIEMLYNPEEYNEMQRKAQLRKEIKERTERRRQELKEKKWKKV